MSKSKINDFVVKLTTKVVMVQFYVKTCPDVVRGGRGWSFSGRFEKMAFLVMCPPMRTLVVGRNSFSRQNHLRLLTIHLRLK